MYVVQSNTAAPALVVPGKSYRNQLVKQNLLIDALIYSDIIQ